MVDIIEEAKEEARLEAIQQFVKKNLNLILLGGALIIGIFTGVSYYYSYMDKKSEQSAQHFIETLEGLATAQPEQQIQKLSALFNARGYSDLAKLLSSQILSADGGNLEELKKLIHDKSIDKNLRQFLIIGTGYTFLNKNISFQNLEPALQDIIKSNGFLKGFAQEILGLWNVQQKNLKEAHAIFTNLSKDALVSEQTRSRADIFRRQIECSEKL